MKYLLLLILTLGVVACESKSAPAPKTTETAPPPAAAAKPAEAAEVEVDDSALPVAADFEDAADKEIDAKNYAQELDALAKSIDDDEP